MKWARFEVPYILVDEDSRLLMSRRFTEGCLNLQVIWRRGKVSVTYRCIDW